MKQGYHATGVKDICREAEVTKGAFFHYFETKQDLGISLLNDYWRLRQSQFADSGWMEQDDPVEQVAGFLAVVADVFMNDPDGYSCLAGSFTLELAGSMPVFRDRVEELFSEWVEQIKPMLRRARVQAQSPDSIDVDLLADYIVSAIEGALVLAIARQDRYIIARHIDILTQHLRLVFA